MLELFLPFLLLFLHILFILMKATFTLHVNEIDHNLLEAIKRLFKNKTITITVEDILEDKATLNPKES